VSSSAQIVTRALKRLGLVDTAESPSAADAADGVAALNAMLASWEAKGVKVSPDVPLPAKHEQGVVALLAVRLAPDYGAEASRQVQMDARDGWLSLQADYISAPLAVFDLGLTAMPSKVEPLTVATVDDWVTLTAYATFDQVLADDRHVYECIIAGTSGATGPHGTGQKITDGTVTWRFIGFST
jgi:hypothetical protein